MSDIYYTIEGAGESQYSYFNFMLTKKPSNTKLVIFY